MKSISDTGTGSIGGTPDKATSRLPDPSGSVRLDRPLGARLRLAAGIAGVSAAAIFFVWLPLGWLEVTPSVIDVFGIDNLRIPAGMTVGGLLLAAIGFNDF